MPTINRLHFQPLRGFSSGHLQTILQVYCPKGTPPPSQNLLIHLEDDNHLSCEVSTPHDWNPRNQTVALIHGLGGSHQSNYMMRLARKIFLSGQRAVRINLRGCGSGKNLSRLPYNASTSGDIMKVVRQLKKQAPFSEIVLIGFSLGGSIILKLAGELEEQAKNLVRKFIAVCSPIDLVQTVRIMEKKRHALYHKYFLKHLCRQSPQWIQPQVRSMYEFDEQVTAPLWGYQSAYDYYHQCSSHRFLPKIQQKTHILLAEDDPFISLKNLHATQTSEHVQFWVTKHGGHLGFLGKAPGHQIYWMDYFLLNHLKDN